MPKTLIPNGCKQQAALIAALLLIALHGNGTAWTKEAGTNISSAQACQASEQEISRLKWEVNGMQSSKAAAANAAWLLGLIHLHGAGTRPDLPQAFDWFTRSLDLGGQAWAHAGLAWCHLEACKGEADQEAAAKHIAALRHTHAARADYLDWLLKTRQGLGSLAGSEQLLQRAARAGDIQAQVELGLRAVSDNKPSQAAQHFRQASPLSPSAQTNIRILQQQSVKIQGRYPDARSPAEDIYRAARANHRGDGRPRNYTEAIRLYRLASSKGNLAARKMLELIYSRPGAAGGVDIGWMSQLAHINPVQIAPALAEPPAPGDANRLQRDPSPLFDLLPSHWQKCVRSEAP